MLDFVELKNRLYIRKQDILYQSLDPTEPITEVLQIMLHANGDGWRVSGGLRHIHVAHGATAAGATPAIAQPTAWRFSDLALSPTPRSLRICLWLKGCHNEHPDGSLVEGMLWGRFLQWYPRRKTNTWSTPLRDGHRITLPVVLEGNAMYYQLRIRWWW